MQARYFVWIILATALPAAAQPAEKTIEIIAFGSCSRESSAEQFWQEINDVRPDLWIWGGDNIYGDTHDMALLKKKYDRQKDHPGYRKLIEQTAITGTWDDHDYGINDGGKYFSRKHESKKLFLDFIGTELNDPVWKHEGIYNANMYGSGERKIKVINLDTRFFRDTVMREHFTDALSGKQIYRNVPNSEGELLGEEQWQWLENELINSTAAINIINSSIQVLSDEHRFEKWSNFPKERRRLLDLIVSSKARGVIIISGDRHIAEISRMSLPGLAYPLVDFTSSGLTHTWSGAAEEKNQHRVGDLIIDRNFGLMYIDWHGKSPRLRLQVRGKEGKVLMEESVRF
jgi:alkaline phosphatase D